MFERFTNSARLVIVFSQKEAKARQCPEVLATHVLLGVMGDGESDAVRISG